MLNRTSIITALCCILAAGCKKDEPTQPPNSAAPLNLISNGSFESNGVPTMTGWSMLWPPDTSQYQHIGFSNDIPPNGGAWSLEIDSLYDSNIKLATYVDLPHVNHRYKLSFWAKTKGLDDQVSLMVTGRGWHVSYGKVTPITDSIWKEYTITSEYMDSLYQQVPDSIRVFQIILDKSNDRMRSGKANFDLFKLEQTD